tara:strand:+ start:2615 stop:3028 length:414 start_codon:yes stop_codon:yes gene_type:complete
MTWNKWQVLTGKTVNQWAEELGQHPETIRCRLKKHGTPYPNLQPVRYQKPKPPKPKFNLQVKPTINIVDPKLQTFAYTDDTPLDMVNDNLSVRALNCLKELNINDIGDLRKINIMRVDKMDGYGIVTRNELIEKFFK